MSRFKINIHQMREENEILKDKYNQYNMDQDSLYKVALTSDGSWNDLNTPVFIQCVNQDSKRTENFHDTIYKCINSITSFTSSLDKLLSNNGVVEKQKNLVYDKEYCTRSIQLLNSCIEELNSAKIKIDGDTVGCRVSKLIQNVRANIVSSMNTLSEIKDGISNITEGIESLIDTTSASIKSYETVQIKDNELKYNWEPISYVRDNRDVFSKKREMDNTAEEKNMADLENTVDKVTGESNTSVDQEKMNVIEKDVSVDKVEEYSSTEEEFNHLETNASIDSVKDVTFAEEKIQNDNIGVLTNEKNDYTISENEMNSISPEMSAIKNENYSTSSKELVMDANNVVNSSKENYEANENLFHSQSSAMSNSQVEEYSSDGNHLNNNANISIPIAREDYSTNSSTVNVSSSIGNIGIKKDSFETSTVGLQNSMNLGLNLEKNSSLDDEI